MNEQQKIFYSELATAEKKELIMSKKPSFEELAAQKFNQFKSPEDKANEIMAKAEQTYKNPIIDNINKRISDLESKSSVKDILYQEKPNPIYENKDENIKCVRDFFNQEPTTKDPYLKSEQEINDIMNYLSFNRAMEILNNSPDGLKITHEAIGSNGNPGYFWKRNKVLYTNSNRNGETTIMGLNHTDYFMRLEAKFKVAETKVMESAAKWYSENSNKAEGNKKNGRDSDGYWF